MAGTLRVLVTGAAGFIGSHLVERLLADGHEVRALIRYTSRGSAGFLSPIAQTRPAQLVITAGDIRDPAAVRDSMVGVSAVLHLGALIGIPYSYLHPLDTLQNNLTGTVNVLTAARELGTELVVHTSTSEVYGTARSVPIGEDHPLQAQSPYAASKIAADKLVESYVNSYGLPCTTIRPFNTYGPRQSARAVIPTIISQGLAGTEISLGNLQPTRDFTFVSDTVDGFVKALESPAAIGRTVNLGTSSEISIGNLAELILGLLGVRGSVVEDGHRVRRTGSEVERLVADNRLARELLGWTPLVGLEEGLAQTIAWVRANPGLYSPATYSV